VSMPLAYADTTIEEVVPKNGDCMNSHTGTPSPTVLPSHLNVDPSEGIRTSRAPGSLYKGAGLTLAAIDATRRRLGVGARAPDSLEPLAALAAALSRVPRRSTATTMEWPNRARATRATTKGGAPLEQLELGIIMV
jgi:hypothetical protein